jgi:hypothetical protein
MNKLKTFFYSFKRSAFDISYYRDIVKVPFVFSLKYLYILLFFVSLFGSLRLAVPLALSIPLVPENVEKFKTYVRTAYPAELEIQVQNGELSTNVQEPYYIDLPDQQKQTNGEYKHMITIDTEGQIENYADYSTLVLVTKKSVAYPDRSNKGTYRVASLDQIKKPVTINKKIYDSFLDEVFPYLQYVTAAVVIFIILLVFVLPFITAVFVMLGYMLYLLVIGVLLWFISSIFKTELTYGKVYQLSMHGITLPILFTTLLGLFSIQVPYIFTAGLLLWMVVILAQLKPVKK